MNTDDTCRQLKEIITQVSKAAEQNKVTIYLKGKLTSVIRSEFVDINATYKSEDSTIEFNIEVTPENLVVL